MLTKENTTGEGASEHCELGRNARQSDSHIKLDGGVSKRAKCPICQSTFRRPEHLKRHIRSHTNERPFECARCGRHFSRTDTRHRHEMSHHSLRFDGGRDRAHRITVKTFRACFKCARARVRCSGGAPCIRCDNRSLECQYPTERRSKSKATEPASQKLPISKGDEPRFHDLSQALACSNDSFNAFPEALDVVSHSLPLNHRMADLQTQSSGLGLWSNPPGILTNLGFCEIVDGELDGIKEGSLLEPEIFKIFSPTSPLSQTCQVADASSQSSDSQQNSSVYFTTSMGDAHFIDPTFMFGNPMSGFQWEAAGSNIDAEMGDAINQQIQSTAEYDCLATSAVNWISSDIIPDAINCQSLPFALVPDKGKDVSIDSTLMRTARFPPEDLFIAKTVSQPSLENRSQGESDRLSQHIHAIVKELPIPKLYDATLQSADCSY